MKLEGYSGHTEFIRNIQTSKERSCFQRILNPPPFLIKEKNPILKRKNWFLVIEKSRKSKELTLVTEDEIQKIPTLKKFETIHRKLLYMAR